jgi:peptidyl-prolyl cis-trans isomerase D
MHFRWFALLIMVFSSAISVFAQSDTTQSASVSESAEDIQAWADVRKAYFKVTKDDSLFVTLNSDAPFELSTYRRGELDGFMENMFFAANKGDVIGPMMLDGYAMIFKVAGFDSTYRVHTSHIFVKPKKDKPKDFDKAEKKAQQLLTELQNGANFEELAKLHGEDETSANGGVIGWLFEGSMTPEFEKAALEAKAGDVFVVRTSAGAHVVKVNIAKVKDRGSITVVPLVKKL